jgi:tetratricopeptide (TPR) repeat protein
MELTAQPASPPATPAWDTPGVRRFLQQYPALCVFAAALLVRLAVLALFSTSPHFGVQSGDMRFYHDWALRILAGEWTDHHAFYGLPGYAFLLAGVYKIFGVHPGVMLTIQSLADACTALLVFRLTRAVVPIYPRALAALAALGWTLFVPAQTFSAVLMPTVLAAACYWFCVDRALHTKTLGSPWRWLGLGALVGVTAMCVATVLFALPLLMAAAVLAPASRSKRAVALALLVAGLAAGTSPAWLHNRLVAHEPVFLSAHGGINFWIGNAPGATGYPKIPPPLRAGQRELLVDSIALAEQANHRPMSRAEVSRYWSEKAWTQIRQEPAAWASLLATKVRNFWNAFSYDDVTIIALLREEGVLLPGLGFGLAATLGLAGLLISGCNPRARWIAAAVVLHMFALLPVFITERYRLAAVPGLLVLGAYGISRAIGFAQTRQWRPLAGLTALLVAAAVFVHWPVQGEMLSSMEPYNLAISELEAGQLDRAEKHLAQAAALAPGNASLLFAHGNLWLKRGDSQRAKSYYRQSLEREPRNADAFTNLGVIACGEKRWDLGARLFETSLSIDPGDPATSELLKRARAELTK